MGTDIMWRPIEGYFGLYEISDSGAVVSLRFNHTNRRQVIKQYHNSNGYMIVKLYKNKKGKTFRVHRLVANTFLVKQKGKAQVNHIDGDKTNNNVRNLEWVDNSENQLHSIHKLGNNRRHLGSPIAIVDSDTGEMFHSISQLARTMGVSRRTITNKRRFQRVDS